MTVEKLYETLKLAIALDDKLTLQQRLEQIRDALNNLVGAPAAPQHQSALANAMSAFDESARKLAASLTPSESSRIAEIGGEEFFDPEVANKVHSSVSANAMTPTVARDFANGLASRRATFLNTVRQVAQGLENLGVKATPLKPGTADISFLIPREIFKNQLGTFSKELGFLTRLMEHYDEALSGKVEPVVLEGLSSSVPTIAVGAGLTVVYLLAKIVDKFLEAWERVERIRKARAELVELGLKGEALEQLTSQIKKTVADVVDSSVKDALANYPGDTGRRNELEIGLRKETRRLFAQIERGLTVQFRAEAKDGETEGENQMLAEVQKLSITIAFPEPSKQPLLLDNGELVDGEAPELAGQVAKAGAGAKRRAAGREPEAKAAQ